MKLRPLLYNCLSGVFVVLLCGSLSGRSTETFQPIDQGWVLLDTESRQIPATIPGCVFTDLFNAGLIPDPFYGDNESEVQWVSKQDWSYKTTFIASKRLLQREYIDLVFKGLDTYAKVYLNRKQIINADNQFREWRVDVKNLILTGENILEVIFRSPFSVQDSLQAVYGLLLPEDNRVFTRKGQWQYGWDWAPSLPSMGIWKPVQLHGYDAARLVSVTFRQDFDNKGLTSLTARFTISAKKETGLVLMVNNSAIKPAMIEITAFPGEQVFEVPVTFSQDVKYWMPAGYGDQNLYAFFCSVIGQGDILVAEKQVITGIRRVELVQERDLYGSSFFFRINGTPVFAKGANWVPADHFSARFNPGDYRRLVNEAAFAGMNMLRVWGGGFYEDDIFYNLCDSSGIMVWQDFMFACGMYPGSDKFLNNVGHEVEYQLRRLAVHPSIVLWCGNNEVSEGWHRWGWSERYNTEDSARVWNSYLALFETMLPDMVKSHSPGTPYWPSSPSLGRGDPAHIYSGDSHYWGVWHDAEPFRMYREKVPRFMSEFGFQSYPAPASLKKFISDSLLYQGSAALNTHQKHNRGDKLIGLYLGEWFPQPSSFVEYAMLSQLVQAEGVVMGILAHREAKPWCMGSLYWQFNDCWPAVSWSSVDYYGNRKALHYWVKQAFAPVIATVNIHQDEIELVLINDDPTIDSVFIELEIMDHSGNRIFVCKEQAPAPFSNNLQHTLPMDVIGAHTLKDLIFVARVFSDGELLSERVTLPVKPKHLPVVKSDIKITVSNKDEMTVITLQSDRFVYGVMVEVEGIQVNFSDNYFCLLPGQKKYIHCIEKIQPSALQVNCLLNQ